jgi:hypothetical protein
MMVTDASFFAVDDLWRGWSERLRRLVARRAEAPVTVAAGVTPLVEAMPAPAVDPHAGIEPADARSARQQRARVAAVRALLQAREGQWDAAERFFREAADLDPELSLSTVPTFWNLPRLGQEAAVRALRRSGRSREASLLAAEIGYRTRGHHVAALSQRLAS